MCVCSAILSVQIFIAHMCSQVILTFMVFVNTKQINEDIFCRVRGINLCWINIVPDTTEIHFSSAYSQVCARYQTGNIKSAA